jgi:D-serine dehydratase
MKQETLEEAIDRIAKEDGYDIDGSKVADFVDGMVKGAKWQAERMYSKEEVTIAYNDAYHKGYSIGREDAESHPLALTIADNIHKDIKKWFQQFKKK